MGAKGIAIVVAILLAGATARADDPPAPTRPGWTPPPTAPALELKRQGLVFGLALGGGVMLPGDCESCDGYGAAAGALHMGVMVARSVALELDASFVVAPDAAGATMAQAVQAVAVQFWTSSQGKMEGIWVKLGAGVGELESEPGPGAGAGVAVGPAALVVVGWDMLGRGTFAVDLQLRWAFGFYDGVSYHGGALAVGVNWY